MNRDVLKYIRTHDYIYHFLREDSSHYQYLLQDKNYIYELDRLAKEKYKLRWSDKMEKMGQRINLIHTFLDLIK